MARQNPVSASRRRRALARSVGRAAEQRRGLDRAVSPRQDAARRDRRGRPLGGVARNAALRPVAPARGRGSDPFRGADRNRCSDRLRGGGRTGDCDARAGAVRPRRTPVGRGRKNSADAASPVARSSADPDHPRPAKLLARLLGCGALRSPRSLSAPLLARRPGERGADQSGEAAGRVRRSREGKRVTPP